MTALIQTSTQCGGYETQVPMDLLSDVKAKQKYLLQKVTIWIAMYTTSSIRPTFLFHLMFLFTTEIPLSLAYIYLTSLTLSGS